MMHLLKNLNFNLRTRNFVDSVICVIFFAILIDIQYPGPHILCVIVVFLLVSRHDILCSLTDDKMLVVQINDDY